MELKTAWVLRVSESNFCSKSIGSMKYIAFSVSYYGLGVFAISERDLLAKKCFILARNEITGLNCVECILQIPVRNTASVSDNPRMKTFSVYRWVSGLWSC